MMMSDEAGAIGKRSLVNCDLFPVGTCRGKPVRAGLTIDRSHLAATLSGIVYPT